uniref:ABC transporter domain-containing protein n=1 Tax=Panagrolaimus sp. JU765 TaxID=591449 RepID=A0AC34QEN2_9BILA
MVGFIFVTNDLTDKVALFQVAQTLYFGAVSLMVATEFFPEFVKSRLAASLMYNIINREPKTGNPNEGERISLEGEVKFENVYFAYPMRPKSAVMKGISLQARPGQTLALVGPSGSGKSTVISLLERVYDPSVGTILLDGKDLKNLCLNDVRRQMSLVEQMPRLFSGTIKENIAYGLDLDKVSMDDIVDAARIANAASFISSLPLGYDTPLGEKGTQLSGGQKQRIAIARAMIRKPKILLLDEATSALDSAAEKAVQEALDRAREGRTCITIAHRLSSIQNSDQIVFVENGRVRERGNHGQLLQMKGRYYNLIQKQHLGLQ